MNRPKTWLDSPNHNLEIKETATATISPLYTGDQKPHLSPTNVSPQSLSSSNFLDSPESPGVPLIPKKGLDKTTVLHSTTEIGDAAKNEDFIALGERDAVS